MKNSKNYLTNLIALAFIIAGYYSPWYAHQIFSVGIFALSGALTNWLAIYMLFEKVPGLYGSGVIPTQFEEFKKGIKTLIMEQFFTEENIKKFFSSGKENSKDGAIDSSAMLGIIDFNNIFNEVPF